MTLRDLAPRDRRALLLGGTILAIVLGTFEAMPAWLSWRDEALAAAKELALELQRTRTTVNGLESVLDSAEARVARFREVGSALLVVQEPAEAPVALTDLLREAARLSSVQVDDVVTRVDTAGPLPLRRVVASVRAVGDIAGLAKLLHRLEGHRVLLAIQELNIQPLSVETPNDAVEQLRIHFTVEGLALVASAGPRR